MSTLQFDQVAALWKQSKRPYVKTSTYAIYIQLLNAHILPRFGKRDSIADADVQDLVNTMLADGYSFKTVKCTLGVLRMIVRFGAQSGAWAPLELRPHFPTAAGGNKGPMVLSRDHQQKLLSYIDRHFSFQNLGILICLYSGLRIGEVCALQWKDIDIPAGVIHIRKTVQRIYLTDGAEHEYFLSIDRPKTLSSIRDIPISSELMPVLKPLAKIMCDDYFIVSNDETPYEPRYYRGYYSRLLKELGIPPLRFHALRHSFATRCIESKCDYKAVSVILGHASISTTMDLYVHPGFDEKKKAIERMAKSMRR